MKRITFLTTLATPSPATAAPRAEVDSLIARML